MSNAKRHEASSNLIRQHQANAAFRKTCEQVRNRVNVRLIADPTKMQKTVAKVGFRCSEIVNNYLVMVQSAKTKITRNKLINVGFAILENSTYIMYSFYCDHLKQKYGDRCSLLFMDTDSLCCEIQTDDLYSDMGDSLYLYDTSNFDPTLPQYSSDNRRVLGNFKKRNQVYTARRVRRSQSQNVQSARARVPVEVLRERKGSPKTYVQKRVRHEHFLWVLRKRGLYNQEHFSFFQIYKSRPEYFGDLENVSVCFRRQKVHTGRWHTYIGLRTLQNPLERAPARAQTPQGSAGGDRIYVQCVIKALILFVVYKYEMHIPPHSLGSRDGEHDVSSVY